jgi:hypothetical protein
MALKIFERYGPRANPADGDYPNGSIKNESSPGTDDGTPLEKDWGNDYEGWSSALLNEADITASGTPDTVNTSQRMEAMRKLFGLNVDHIKQLSTVAVYDGVQYNVTSFYDGNNTGGGSFVYDSTRNKAEHDGVTIIDPDRVTAWNGTAADLTTLYTVGSGSGCFVRISIGGLHGDAFGLSSDTTGNAAAFVQAAQVYSQIGTPIEIKTGDYPLSSSVNVTGARFKFFGTVTTTGGNLNGALVEILDASNGSVSYGVGEENQFGSYYRFGRIKGGATGLVVGGAEPSESQDGNVVYADSYAGWSAIQPTKYTSSTEIAVQPSDAVGTLETQAGTGNVIRQSGETFNPDWIGRRIYLPGETYIVDTVTDGDNLTVKNVGGSPVSFPTTETKNFQVTGILMVGSGTLAGGTFTRTTGDPFVPGTGFEYNINLNGTLYAVGSIVDSDTVTVISPPADGNYNYIATTTIDDIAAAVRVHKTTGLTAEQNITLAAYASGKFHLYSATSDTEDFPFFIGNEFESGGEERRQISLYTDGYTAIGGDAGSSLQIPYQEGFVATKAEIVGSTNSVIIRSVSSNPDADMLISAKGTGHVGFGFHVASADAPVTGYIEIKDLDGIVRKLAVIS